MFVKSDNIKLHCKPNIGALLLAMLLALQVAIPVAAGEPSDPEAGAAGSTVTEAAYGPEGSPAAINMNGAARSRLLPPGIPPVLTAEGDNDNNMVKLNWTSSLAGEEYYMVYQRDTGGDGLDEFQSIPLKKDIKVLNVYPDITGSDQLYRWMNDIMNSAPAGYTMMVEQKPMHVFNINPSEYLFRDGSGRYNYDVVYFGSWDAFNNYDLSTDAKNVLEAFIQFGGGLFMGHDTAWYAHPNFSELGTNYFNLILSGASGARGDGTKVVVKKKGFLTNFPFELGDVGKILTVPESHVQEQAAKGDVWFTYNKSGDFDYQGATKNFYLTTWNNTALIQTGHSSGQASTDEQKILANTLFYLAQTSDSLSFDDRMSQDLAAPNPVSGNISVTAGSSPDMRMLRWNEAADNGSSYDYYMKAVSYADGSSQKSAETTATVTTGVKGYAILVDQDPGNNDPGNTVTTIEPFFEATGLFAGVEYYAHIKTIDKAGNASAISTVAFTVPALASGLTVRATGLLGEEHAGKGKVTIGEAAAPGHTFVYINAGNGALSAPAVGETLTGYTSLPADGVITAAAKEKIGVAEVDADGKVIRFGQTTMAGKPPVLTAVGDNANNMVKLNWTSSSAGEEYYMVYQKDTGGDGVDEFQSIPLKKDIKVLNVYPNSRGSDGLQGWMQSIMQSAPADYGIQVDKVLLADFNGNDTSTNYAHYLTKGSNGAYEYDVLYFGAWDANDFMDLSVESRQAVEGFIQYGGGVLFGHDTASFDHVNFIDLAQKYLKMDVRYNNSGLIPTIGSKQVVIQRRGFPMNYPFALGDIGEILYTPESHSFFQFASGDVWFKFTNTYWGNNQEINTFDGKKGTNNFYLTTWNNTALIQTGHSNGAATVDEQKILANTLFYLAQISTSNSFDDRMSQDVAAPNPVSGNLAVTVGSASGKKLLQWNEALDNGSTYAYYLKAVPYTGGSSRDSVETTATVTTGVKGYAVTVDTNSANADPGNTVTTATYSYEVSSLQPGVTYYAHIKTIDNAGNTSAIYTIPFMVDASGLTVESTDPSGKANDGKTRLSIAEEVGQGNKLVYLNAGGSGNVAVPGFGDELNPQSGYQELPANGLIPAANGDKIAVAEVNASGQVVRFGQTIAQTALSAAELAVASVDPAGAENDGKTQMVAGVGSGNKLVYVNFGKGEITEPSQGQLLTGYTDLPGGGIIVAERDDKIGIAEVDAEGKVVRYGVTEAKVSAEAEAKGLTVTVTDPTGAGTDGKTQVTASAGNGNKLVYVNFKQEPVSIPDMGSSLEGLGYVDLPAGGLVEASEGDLLGVAEVDPSGKVVRYVTVPAAVTPENAAKGLNVGTKDAAGAENEGKTQLTGSVGEGHKLVYLNFGEGPVTAPTTGEPIGNGYVDVPAGGAIDARNGDLLGVAEVDEHGNVVKFGTTRAVVTPESAAKGLPVAATDAGGAGTDGQTKLVSKAAEGNKLVYVNFGEGPVNVPGVGETLAGYTELPESGLVGAKPGDKIGVAEIGPDGKVVKYGVAEAVVTPEQAAKNLAVVSTDPAGEGTEGKTKLGTAIGTAVGAGNKLVYVNAGKGAVSVPENGAVLSGYAEVPANGLVDAQNGDNLGIAEVDASGKVIRFGTLKAAVESDSAAKGLVVGTTDPAGEGTEGKTKLTTGTDVSPGNKLVYLNFGKSSFLKPNAGDTLNGYAEVPEDGLIDAGNGDSIGVAEVDDSGKVIRFGVAEATVKSETAAQGLQVISVDPTGSANDGKSVIIGKAAAGNKLVYVNFGNGTLLTPDVGEVLTGYVELPADGLVSAKNGDHIAVAEVDASGRVVRFGWVIAEVIDASNESSEESPVVVPAKPETKGVEVLVNGKIEYAGTATISSDNDRTLTTIDVDQARLQAKLDAEGTGAVVTIPWNAQSDIVIGQLTGQMVKNMEDKEAILVLDTPAGAYKIPTEQIRISSLTSQLGSNVKLEDVKLQVHIALAAPNAAKEAEGTTAKAGVTLMAAPVTFTVNAEYAGTSIEITDYSVYVERTVALPEGIDPAKITTGVVLEPDGTLRHVPTKVTKVNESYYAQINSLTNSDYGVIWNLLEFADVSAHWSKDAVNDMGSRLVVNGVGGGKFNPDADMTRAEFAAIIVRGLGLRLDKGSVPFTDVADSQWYASVVNTAYKFGLMAGYEDGTFKPQERITRQEAMTIIARAMKITGLQNKLSGLDLSRTLESYQDAGAVADWARDGVALSVAGQIVNGRTATTLESGAYITRAEVAAIVQRLLQKSGLI